MPRAEVGDLRQKRCLDHARRWLAWQNLRQRSAIKRIRAGEIRPRGHQKRAAVLHISPHIVEIEHRQNAAPLIAVENDQVELVNRLHEQLPRRERDEAQLGHRHAILPIRRAQNGKMHQVDGRVGFQKVAPGALPRMRLPRNQQHAEPVTHAVDLHNGGIVAVCQLARRVGHDELDHIHPRMRQGQRQGDVFANRHLEAARRITVDGNQQFRPPGDPFGHRALILNPQGQRHLFVQDREGRCVLDQQAPVPIARPAGQKCVDRCGHVGHKARIV